MSYDTKPFEDNSTSLTANDNAALDKIHRTAEKELIRAAVTIVDGDGEFEFGGSYARITVIDTLTVRIFDGNGAATQIEVNTQTGIQFRVIAESLENFQIDTFLRGDWEQVLLDSTSDIIPTRHWTFDDGSECRN